MKIEDLKVLVCDDSILARKQIKDILLTIGTPTFFEASDGQAAISTYKEVRPDLVFLDIVMPHSLSVRSKQVLRTLSRSRSTSSR